MSRLEEILSSLSPEDQAVLRIALDSRTKQDRTNAVATEIFNNAPFNYLVLDSSSRILGANPQFGALSKTPSKDLKGKKLSDLLLPEDREKFLEDYALFDPKNPLKEKIYRLSTADGTELHIGAVYRGHKLREGLRHCVIFDRTLETKRAEILHRSVVGYRKLVKNAPIAIFQLDVEKYKFERFNDRLCSYTGYSRAELRAISLATLLSETDFEEFRKTLRVSKPEQRSFLKEYSIRKKDGSSAWIRFNVSPRGTSKDRMLIVATDVSDEMTAMSYLEEQEQTYKSIIEDLGEGFITSDPAAKVTYANKFILDKLGMTLDEICEKTILDLLVPEDKRIVIEQIKKRAKGEQGKYQVRMQGNKNPFPVLISANPMRDSDGKIKGTYGILTDLTEVVRVHETIERAHLNTIRSFASIIDIGTPHLKGHGGRVSIITRDLGELMGLDKRELDYAEIAALLHDVGMITLPTKMHQYTEDNCPNSLREQFMTHSQEGYDILRGIEGMSHVSVLVLCHHENFDGSGYPKKMSGESIPLESRIIRIADKYDTIVSLSPANYVREFTQEEKVPEKSFSEQELLDHAAIFHFKKHSGTKYDPEVVLAFENYLLKRGLYVQEDRFEPDQLVSGMVLSRPLYLPNGLFLMPKGTVLDPKLIERLTALDHTRTLGNIIYVSREK